MIRRAFLLFAIALGLLIASSETEGKTKKYSGNCGYNKGKYYCCYLTGTGAVCYPETPPPPANP